jgi:hypothetical protein
LYVMMDKAREIGYVNNTIEPHFAGIEIELVD